MPSKLEVLESLTYSQISKGQAKLLLIDGLGHNLRKIDLKF